MPVNRTQSECLDIIESELNSVLEQDSKYWRENDAKFRAVAQNATYEQFEEIVKASHLRPLDKSDKTPSSKPKTSIWNSIANATSRKSEDKKMDASGVSKVTSDPRNLDEFYDIWKNIEICDRIKFMQDLGLEKSKKIFTCEVPSELIAEFLYTFLTFGSSCGEMVLVVRSVLCFYKSTDFLKLSTSQVGVDLYSAYGWIPFFKKSINIWFFIARKLKN